MPAARTPTSRRRSQVPRSDRCSTASWRSRAFPVGKATSICRRAAPGMPHTRPTRTPTATRSGPRGCRCSRRARSAWRCSSIWRLRGAEIPSPWQCSICRTARSWSHCSAPAGAAPACESSSTPARTRSAARSPAFRTTSNHPEQVIGETDARGKLMVILTLQVLVRPFYTCAEGCPEEAVGIDARVGAGNDPQPVAGITCG